MKVCILEYDNGWDYDDHRRWVVGVYTSGEMAAAKKYLREQGDEYGLLDFCCLVYTTINRRTTDKQRVEAVLVRRKDL